MIENIIVISDVFISVASNLPSSLLSKRLKFAFRSIILSKDEYAAHPKKMKKIVKIQPKATPKKLDFENRNIANTKDIKQKCKNYLASINLAGSASIILAG